jgi:membrane fusion protein (multidrug efflux system)
VRARVSGILERQLFREGEPIRAGAPMYRIDRAPFEIALAQARATLAETRSRAERAQLEAKRLQSLLADRAISQREYDDAAATRLQTQALVLAAQARVREAELNLSYTTVNAPIAGITGRALRSEGSLVTAGAESSLLTTLTRTDPIWVRFSLSESEYAQLRGADERSAKVHLTLPDGSTYERSGSLNFTGSTVDARLGTVQLRAEFANPSLALLPGQYVKARVEIGAREAFVVPQSAVQQGDRGRFVWVVDAQGKVNPRPVETGGWVGRDWIVRSGLQAGDRVAIDNLIRLRPGATVEPRPSEPASTAGAGGAR